MTKPITVTYIGGEGAGDGGECVWGNAFTGTIKFPLNKPVTLDPAKVDPKLRPFVEHVMTKIVRSRFFEVAEGAKGDPAVTTDAVPEKRGKKAKAAAEAETEPA